MGVRNLLEKLDRFENLLTDYAYDELTSRAAVDLKNKFQTFKTDLERKVFNEIESEDSNKEFKNTNGQLQLPKKVFKNASNTAGLLNSLKRESFNDREDIIQKIEINNLILMELSMNILKNQINNSGKI